MDYVLKDPVTVGERTLYEIHTNAPKLKDLCAVGVTPIGSAEADLKLLSSLTGESQILIGQISARDWANIGGKLSKIWEEFFSPESEGAARRGKRRRGTPRPKTDLRGNPRCTCWHGG